MKHNPTSSPRTWIIFALCAIGVGIGTADFKTLWDVEYASQGGRWEVMALWLSISILCCGAALARWLEEHQPQWRDQLLRQIDRLTERRWLGLAAGTWVLGWAVFHGTTDPNWVASGIDWHDSHLDAYSLLNGDPPLYCAWRYPLYPMLAATVSHWSGWDLQITTQLVSRLLAVATAVPLYMIGRRLFGRGPGIAGVLLLLGLATYRMHTDAVTPYPLVMFLAVAGAATLIEATRGGWLPWLLTGTITACLLANDGKSLLIALGFTGMACVLALIVPWRWRPGEASGTAPKIFRGLPGGAALRTARLVLLVAPIALSYQWMGNLPVKAFTLEEMAVAYLLPGGRGANQAPRNLQQGYMWGHFDDAWTIPRTLHTFWEAGQNPEMAKQNARQLRTSLQRLRLDYPGFTTRIPVVLGLCLLLPLVRRRGRLQTLFQVGAVGVVLLSCWPSIKSDYQERYVVHGAVLLPLLWMGGVGMLAHMIVGSRTRIRRTVRGGSVLVTAIGLLIWPANPVGFAQLGDRLDPVAMGGLQEHEVAEWGREQLQQGDLLLDTSWMMQALLLSGQHTIARGTNAYPPGGAAWPAGSWRFTRPWPEERESSGRYFALVNYLAMAPNTFDASHVPIEELITEPDTDMGKQIAADQTRWTEVFRTSDTIVRVYQWNSPGAPPRWQTRRKPM